ncbi:MAG: hypothetical protein ACLQKK_07770 [Rhodomicrobium sp.]
MQIDERNERLKAMMHDRLQGDFIPFYPPENRPKAEDRIAIAVEYIAFQMGQMNNKLDMLIEALASSHAQS